MEFEHGTLRPGPAPDNQKEPETTVASMLRHSTTL